MNIRKTLRTAGLAAFVSGFGLLGGTMVVHATAPPGHKVTICHATASATNPYVVETVDIASIQSFVSGSGHGASGINSGDIIPPFTYAPDNFSFAGQGDQSILANGCTVVSSTPTPTPTGPASTPTPTAPSSSPSPSAPPAGVNPTPSPTTATNGSSPRTTTPTPTGGVLGESLAATGSNDLPLGLGLMLVLLGGFAVAAAAISVRRLQS